MKIHGLLILPADHISTKQFYLFRLHMVNRKNAQILISHTNHHAQGPKKTAKCKKQDASV